MTYQSEKTLSQKVGVYIEEGDIYSEKTIQIFDPWKDETYVLHPGVLSKRSGAKRFFADEINDPKVYIKLIESGSSDIQFNIAFGKRDWVVLKSLEKPMVGLLWFGSIIMALGFSISLFKRFGELRLRGIQLS